MELPRFDGRVGACAGTSSFWETSWGATVADESAEALVLFASTTSSSYHLNLGITARHLSDQPCDHRNCLGVEPTIWQKWRDK